MRSPARRSRNPRSHESISTRTFPTGGSRMATTRASSATPNGTQTRPIATSSPRRCQRLGATSASVRDRALRAQSGPFRVLRVHPRPPQSVGLATSWLDVACGGGQLEGASAPFTTSAACGSPHRRHSERQRIDSHAERPNECSCKTLRRSSGRGCLRSEWRAPQRDASAPGNRSGS